MSALSRTLGDVLLGAFAVVVVAGSVVVLRQANEPVVTTLSGSSASPVLARGNPVATRATANDLVVVAGPDLIRLKAALASDSGDRVEVVAGTATDVVPAASLDAITATPQAVVVEIVAGTKTSLRTTTAITAVRTRWPGTEVVVVGPFSSADRKSAAAAKAAAAAAHATFLDPVDLHWRADDGSASLTAADERAVARRLADALH